MSNFEIIKKYMEGEMSLETANAELNGVKLDPDKNVLTEAERWETTVGYYPEQANGWGLLDSGTGTMDKVQVKDGCLMNCDMGEAFAMVFIGGKTYEVKGTALI